LCLYYSSFGVIFLSATIEKQVNTTIVQWQNDQQELLKKDQLQREDLLQSDLLQREDLLQSDLLQREELLQERDQLHEKQREQLQKDEDKILNRLSLLASDNL
jgi:hypothetical protein